MIVSLPAYVTFDVASHIIFHSVNLRALRVSVVKKTTEARSAQRNTEARHN